MADVLGGTWLAIVDDDPSRVRARLLERYGAPRRLPDDVDGEVLVFAHGSRAAACAFALADRRVFGHPCEHELREGVGWVSVVDLRPRLAELDAAARSCTGYVYEDGRALLCRIGSHPHGARRG